MSTNDSSRPAYPGCSSTANAPMLSASDTEQVHIAEDTQSCPFLALPRELRDMIYEQVFEAPFRPEQDLSKHTEIRDPSPVAKIQGCQALLQTCHLIRNELTPLMYQRTLVHAVVMDGRLEMLGRTWDPSSHDEEESITVDALYKFLYDTGAGAYEFSDRSPANLWLVEHFYLSVDMEFDYGDRPEAENFKRITLLAEAVKQMKEREWWIMLGGEGKKLRRKFFFDPTQHVFSQYMVKQENRREPQTRAVAQTDGSHVTVPAQLGLDLS